MQTKNVGYCRRPSNDCKVSFVEIFEGFLPRLTLYLPHDLFRGISSLLHRNLRHARQRFPIRVQIERQISDDIDVRKISDCKVGADLNPSPMVGLSSCAFRQRLPWQAAET